jgi:hypothetical protein
MSHLTIQHISLSPVVNNGFVKVRNNDKIKNYNSNLLFELNGLTAEIPNHKQIGLRLMQASFPNVFSNIKETNNKLAILVTHNENRQQTTIIIPTGEYTAATLTSLLQSSFTNYFSSFFTGIVFQFTVSQTTGILTILCNLSFSIIYDENTPFYVLGLPLTDDQEYPLQSTIANGLYQISGTNICNFLGVTNILIASNIFRTMNIDVANGYGFLANVPVTSPMFGMIFYTNASEKCYTFPDRSYIDTIDISLRDQNGNLLNFQRFNWSIILEIQFEDSETIRENVPQFVNKHNAAILKKNQSKKKRKLNTPLESDTGLGYNEKNFVKQTADFTEADEEEADQEEADQEEADQEEADQEEADQEEGVQEEDEEEQPADDEDQDSTVNNADENILESAYDGLFPAEM